ncbi:MAG TPA: cytochrome P450, partial [Pseudolabrys sp.]|nr:cytochrome P450 [Pseudolabrys sp.]
MTTSANANESSVRPAAPVPPARRLGFLALWRAVRENPIATVPQPVYEKPAVWLGRWWKPSLFLNDPAGIERVLLGNAANYRKSPQQLRRIQPALGDGLLTAEGETWRAGRRIAAPLFAPKAVAALNDDMVAAAETMSARWRDECTQGPLDLAAQFQRLTYEIVSRTVFSGALDAERVMVHTEMARYFDSIGRVDLATMLNLPPWIPSWSQWRGGPSIAAFRAVIGKAVKDRLAARASGAAFDDLLERLSLARDPQTGEPMPDAVVTDNVLTFLAAGHETTGNALTWIAYLLTLFPEAEAELLAEMESELGGKPAPAGSLERLPFTRA